ncbi:hypothetical protein IGI04_042436 [Brassica rapa subsp. trilocularis]|uniref:Uncharacterized protein n=1 Tax=Brassica rapa subsp. trilocularis TaxID=1813537 RepID=A0ABQ7KJF6_BRACM|nr:hypothetical protein IGI04_042436 [Brassica rapa subsp. trilocularis]
MDTHGHTRTATDVLCVLTDSRGCPVCAGGHPRTSFQGKGQGAESKASVLICVLMDIHGRPVCADGHTRTATDVLCVLTDTHGHSPRGPKSPEQSTKRVSVLSSRTNVLICVLMDSHGRPVCADGHTQTHADTHGQLRTSYSPRGPKSPEQSTGRASVLSPTTNVLICVLMDSHRRHVCADELCQTHTDTHGPPQTSCVCWRTPTDVMCVLNRQPTWAKITRTVHGKGQRAESKDQRADMCTNGQPRTSCVC